MSASAVPIPITTYCGGCGRPLAQGARARADVRSETGWMCPRCWDKSGRVELRAGKS